MTRTDGDNLLANCCLTPTDGTARNALIDWLKEAGDDFLADALSGADGEKHVRRSLEISLRLEQKVELRHLFAAVAEIILHPVYTTTALPSLPLTDVERAAAMETVSRHLPRGIPLSPTRLPYRGIWGNRVVTGTRHNLD